MLKKKFRYIILIILGLMISLCVNNYLLGKAYEKEIFCERLSTGLSEEDVFRILEEYGEIITSGPGVPTGNVYEISFSFVDHRILGKHLFILYRSYTLTFWEGKYDGAYYMVGLDQVRSPCE